MIQIYEAIGIAVRNGPAGFNAQTSSGWQILGVFGIGVAEQLRRNFEGSFRANTSVLVTINPIQNYSKLLILSFAFDI
jgi:hypothetical protein